MTAKRKLTRKQVAEVCAYLCGTCLAIDDGLEATGLDANDDNRDQVAAAVQDHDIEKCVQCDWWCELSELNCDGGEYVCTDCEPRQDDD